MASHPAPLEKELKYLLTKTSYTKLISVTRRYARETVKHTNYYFDDSRLRLRKQKFGLRVRILDGKRAFVTLKEPAKTKQRKIASLKIRHEWETEIPLKTAKAIINGKITISTLKVLPIRILKKRFDLETLENVSVLGNVKTVRTIVVCKNRVELEIDKFKMFNRKFYELEVETEKPVLADRSVKTLLRRHNIPYLPISKSKLGRFLDLWKKAQ